MQKQDETLQYSTVHYITVHYSILHYSSVSQPPGRGPVLGPGINYTAPQEARGNHNMLQDFISPVDN